MAQSFAFLSWWSSSSSLGVRLSRLSRASIRSAKSAWLGPVAGLRDWREQGVRAVAFVIGDAHGFDARHREVRLHIALHVGNEDDLADIRGPRWLSLLTWRAALLAAAVIGGTALSGGLGTIHGAILGALIMQSLQSGMAMVGVDAPFQNIVVGGVLVIAVLIDIIYRKRTGGK